MQLVVCDTSILFPGLVSENGIYRKLLVVFAWSKLHMYLRAAEEEHAEVQRLLEAHPGATLGGNYDPAARVQRAKERIAVLEEHLPAMTPTDFGLVISSPITKELEDNMAGVRSRIGNLDPETIQANIAAAVSIASRHVIDGFDGPIPDYAEGRDPKDSTPLPEAHTKPSA